MLHIIFKGVCESEVEGTCVKEWEVTFLVYRDIYTVKSSTSNSVLKVFKSVKKLQWIENHHNIETCLFIVLTALTSILISNILHTCSVNTYMIFSYMYVYTGVSLLGSLVDSVLCMGSEVVCSCASGPYSSGFCSLSGKGSLSGSSSISTWCDACLTVAVSCSKTWYLVFR